MAHAHNRTLLSHSRHTPPGGSGSEALPSLEEASQTLYDSAVRHSAKGEITETKIRQWWRGGRLGRRLPLTTLGQEGTSQREENVPCLERGGSYTGMCLLKTTELYT